MTAPELIKSLLRKPPELFLWSFPDYEKRDYRFLLDCESIEAASFFVSALYLSLFNTFDALSSSSAPVCLLGSFWDKAEAANDFAVSDEFSSDKVFEAKAATSSEVVLVFLLIIYTPLLVTTQLYYSNVFSV